jgi:hypothetical protein
MARYVPLNVQYFEDPRIMEVRPLARGVFLVGLCIAGRNESDGHFTSAQVRRDCNDYEDLDGLVDELEAIGLWVRTSTGYTIPSFLKWNKSRAELDELREKRSKSGKLGGRPKQDASLDESKLLGKEKQDASLDESKLLGHVKAIEQNITEHNNTELSRRSQANALKDLSFGQQIKPTKGVAPVVNMFERLLKAGHCYDEIEVAIRAGVEVWTDDGVAYAISQSKEKTSTSSSAITDQVEKAVLAIEDWYLTPEPRDIAALPPLAQLAAAKLKPSVLKGNVEVLRTHIRKLATSKTTS